MENSLFFTLPRESHLTLDGLTVHPVEDLNITKYLHNIFFLHKLLRKLSCLHPT